MSLEFDAARLEIMLRDFYVATGVSMDVLRDDFSSLDVRLIGYKKFCDTIKSTRKGREGCDKCNHDVLQKCKSTGKVAMSVCHAGLVHIAVPIVSDNNIIAYIILGRYRRSERFDESEKLLSDLPIDMPTMREYYTDLVLYEKDKVESIINIASVYARYFITEKIIYTNINDNLDRVLKYITDNLEREMTVDSISRATHISKSVIYRNFNAHLGCTVSEYINKKRVDKSKLLLKKTDLSIDAVAKAVGFSSEAYYVSVFNKLNGITPLKFRKQNFLQV